MEFVLQWRRPLPETKLYQEYRTSIGLSTDQADVFASLIAGDSNVTAVEMPGVLQRYYEIPQSAPV